jgi:DNA-binding NtrC family response regulator
VTSKGYKILVVDDDREMGSLLSDLLQEEGYAVLAVTDSLEASRLLKKEEFDILITDLKMKGLKGLDLLEETRKVAPMTPVIIITAFGTIQSAIQAIKLGAYDYITKPFQIDEMVLTVRKALENRLLKKEVVRLKKEVEEKYRFQQLIGKSPAMQHIYTLIERVQESPGNVLITGESGTGKELVAKAIHYNSHRRSGPFVAINCAAIPETLLESELFGYRKGAFTDARMDKKGLFLEASGGTVFLDEITEIPLMLQAKLLRVIEEKTFRPLGDTRSRPLDARLMAASNRKFKDLIRQERFREDLYYRLKVIDIELPPLRDRREDIPLLAHHFLDKFARETSHTVSSISTEALKILMNALWPGNVRELENVIHRAVTLCCQEAIPPEDLPPYLQEAADQGDLIESGLHRKRTLAQLELEYIKKVLLEVGGNKSRAAEILGLDRKTLYRKLEGLKF